MSSGGGAALSSLERPRGRSIVSFQGWQGSDLLSSGKGSLGQSGPEAGRVCGPQFQDWGGHDGSCLWAPCGPDQDVRPMEEPGVPTLCQASEKSPGGGEQYAGSCGEGLTVWRGRHSYPRSPPGLG